MRPKREGIYSLWLIHFFVQSKPIQHSKAPIPQLKKKGYSCIFIISSLFSTVVQLWTLSKKLMVLSNVTQTTGRSAIDRITHAPKPEGAERPRK